VIIEPDQQYYIRLFAVWFFIAITDGTNMSSQRKHREFAIRKFHVITETFLSLVGTDANQDVDLLIQVSCLHSIASIVCVLLSKIDVNTINHNCCWLLLGWVTTKEDHPCVRFIVPLQLTFYNNNNERCSLRYSEHTCFHTAILGC